MASMVWSLAFDVSWMLTRLLLTLALRGSAACRGSAAAAGGGAVLLVDWLIGVTSMSRAPPMAEHVGLVRVNILDGRRREVEGGKDSNGG